MRIFLFLTLFVLLPQLALAQEGDIQLDVPVYAKQGSAVKVKASVSRFAEGEEQVIVFSWLKKTVKASTMPVGDRWEAEMLIPIDVDATQPMQIKASTPKRSKVATLAIKKVKWSEQQISVQKKFVTPPKSVREQIQRDREHSRKALATVSAERMWGDTFVRPVSGVVTSAFGGRRMFNKEVKSYHRGVDLRGATGTPIKALAAGEVLLAESMFYAGNVVYVDHGQGVISIYCHMSEFAVKAGDKVEAGQILGKVGATGRVTGPHLHLGLVILGQSVNALSLFPEESKQGNTNAETKNTHI